MKIKNNFLAFILDKLIITNFIQFFGAFTFFLILHIIFKRQISVTTVEP